jgi:hypothetical protein
MSLSKIMKRENFKKWIESLDDEKIIGYWSSPKSCPLSTFIKENLESVIFVSSHDENIYVKTLKSGKVKDSVFKTPNWAKEVVKRVDSKEGMIYGQQLTKSDVDFTGVL